MNNEHEDEIDLVELFFLLKRKIWIILAAGLILATATGIFTKFCIKPMYSSTAKLYILSQSTSITSLADLQIGTSLTKDYVQLVQSRPVVEDVIANLNLNRTYEEVLSQMTFENPADTRILVITAEDNDPVLAKDMVDEFAAVAGKSISKIMKADEPSVVELGYVSEKPVSPNLLKNIAIGFLLGVFLAAAIIIVLNLIDDTVKSPEDIEKYLGLNTLTSIPLREGEQKTSRFKLSKKNRKGKSDGK